MLNLTDYQDKFEQAYQHTRAEVAKIRTGKASAQLLDDVKIEAYGSQMKVNEVANVSVPDPNMLIITPWDKTLLPNIEKAIIASDLNLNPVIDGDLVRLVVPSLTQERRQEMVKILQQKVESGRVMVRSARSDLKKEIESQKGQAGISEDDIETELKELETLTKQCMQKLDELAQAKEKELLTI